MVDGNFNEVGIFWCHVMRVAAQINWP